MELFFAPQTRFGDRLRPGNFHTFGPSVSLSDTQAYLHQRSSADPQLSIYRGCGRGGCRLGRSGVRVLCAMAGTLALMAAPVWVRAQQPQAAGQLVREVVYNELHDHNNHGYWRYWIQQRIQNATRLEEEVETNDGPVTRLVATN